MVGCVCFVCGKPTPGAELVYFKETKRNKTWGGFGNPPNAGWFCEAHHEKAKKLSELTIKDAIEKIRKNK